MVYLPCNLHSSSENLSTRHFNTKAPQPEHIIGTHNYKHTGLHHLRFRLYLQIHLSRQSKTFPILLSTHGNTSYMS